MFTRALFASVCLCACAVLAEEAYAQERPSQQLVAEHRSTPIHAYPGSAYRQLGYPNYAYDNTYSDGAEAAVWDEAPATGLLDLLPFPKHLVFVVLGGLKWFAAHASLLILGAVMMVGLCTLTPFCAISFSKFEQLESLPAEYYRRLDDAQRSLREAIDKYSGDGR